MFATRALRIAVRIKGDLLKDSGLGMILKSCTLARFVKKSFGHLSIEQKKQLVAPMNALANG